MKFPKIISSHPNQNMVPSDPPCCVSIRPASDVLGFDEEILKSWKTWDLKMAEITPMRKECGTCSLPEVKI
jgi:hypothetical protein